ncbi:hypothetical protein [Akkermansia sp.]|uniref:hypothetical protein n=1 Tax=Akkermansia sp. TaxID=1872421 RepID=UPI003992768C
MNIRTHIQTLLICTMTLAAQGQSVVDPGPLPRPSSFVEEGGGTVRPDESGVSPMESVSRLGQRIVNRIAATVNGRPITANEVSVRLMPIGAAGGPVSQQGPEYKQRPGQRKHH